MVTPGGWAVFGLGAGRNVQVDIGFFKEIRVDAKLLRARAGVGERRAGGFLHHIAERTGDHKAF